MYYFLLVLSTLLYALAFYLNQRVERECESGFDTAVLLSTVSWAGTFVLLMIVMRADVQFTPFSLLCALIHSFCMVLFAVLNLKALSKVDLSKYSMFTMLGGMLVPFAAGILFFSEPLSVGKILCCILVMAALYLDSRGGKTDKKAVLYLIAVFFVNGSFGVITTVHQNSGMEVVGSLQYMAMSAIIISLFGAIWLAIRKIKNKDKKIVKTKKAYINMLLYGLVNNGAELILLVAIKHVQATVQYPIVTGGVIIFSTLLSLLLSEKKNYKSLIPVGVAFAGLLCLL